MNNLCCLVHTVVHCELCGEKFCWDHWGGTHRANNLSGNYVCPKTNKPCHWLKYSGAGHIYTMKEGVKKYVTR